MKNFLLFINIISIGSLVHPQDDAQEFCKGYKSADTSWQKDCICGFNACNEANYWDEETGKINAAYNKDVSKSSRGVCPTDSTSCPEGVHTPPACSVVNGNRNGVMISIRSPKRNCILTDTEDRKPHWKLNFGRVYTITDMTIYGQENQELTWILGLSVLVDAQLCKEFENYGTSADQLAEKYDNDTIGTEKSIIKIDCPRPLTGQTVLLQKHHTEDLSKTIINFCEFEVYVCPPGKYLVEGRCHQCPDNCDYGCDNHFGCLGFPGRPYNIAVDRPVESSSVDASNKGENAVDGRVWSSHDCFSTIPDQAAKRFWRVKFGAQLHVVYYFTVYFHQDDFFLSSVLEVSVIHKTLSDYTAIGVSKCGRLTSQFGRQQNLSCQSPGNRYPVGRILEISAPHSLEVLRLCEVLVFGSKVAALGVGQACDGDCKLSSCGLGLKCEHKKCKRYAGQSCSSLEECPVNTECQAGYCKFLLGLDCSTSKRSCANNTQCLQTLTGFKCKRPIQAPCEKDSDCFSALGETVCDYLKTCRLAISEPCSYDEQCPAGAVCKIGCECLESVDMDPLYFNFKDLASIKTKCQPKVSRISFCGPGLVRSRDDLKCKVQPGGVCSSSRPCASQYICQRNLYQKGETICKIPVGVACDGPEYEKLCSYSTMCDPIDKACKYVTGHVCHPVLNQNCSSGSVCKLKACRSLPQQFCRAAQDCTKGYVCSAKQLCKVGLEHRCSTEPDGECVEDTVCDSDDKCRVPLHLPCWEDKICCLMLTCDAEKHLCKRKLRTSCANDEECTSDALCDTIDRTCRLKWNSNCTERETSCHLGASCFSDTCDCTDNAFIQNSRCVPKEKYVGSICDASLVDACVDEAYCAMIANGSTCACTQGFAVDSDLNCKLGSGKLCNAKPCIAGHNCTDQVCRIELDEPCPGDKAGFCVEGAVCDSSEFCKETLGGNCSDNSEICSVGTVCDTCRECKTKVGGPCQYQSDCVVGSYCHLALKLCACDTEVSVVDKQGICQPKNIKGLASCADGEKCPDSNSECIEEVCVCRDNYTPDRDFSCKIAAGEGCNEDTQYDGGCVEGTLCDTNVNKCLIEPGYECDPDFDLCYTDAVCGRGGFCKVRPGQRCTGKYKDHCSNETVCDNTFKCKRPRFRGCFSDEPDSCVAGAVCEDGVCTCVEFFTEPEGNLCLPKEGRLTAKCVDGHICDAFLTVCNKDGNCSCISEAHPKLSDYSCVLAYLPSSGGVVNFFTGLALIGVLVLLLFFAVWILILKIRKHQRKKAKALERLQQEEEMEDLPAHNTGMPAASKTEVMPQGQKLSGHIATSFLLLKAASQLEALQPEKLQFLFPEYAERSTESHSSIDQSKEKYVNHSSIDESKEKYVNHSSIDESKEKYVNHSSIDESKEKYVNLEELSSEFEMVIQHSTPSKTEEPSAKLEPPAQVEPKTGSLWALA